MSKCKTPGAIFHIEITPQRIGVVVDMPKEVEMGEAEAEGLEDDLHDAMEEVLSRFFG